MKTCVTCSRCRFQNLGHDYSHGNLDFRCLKEKLNFYLTDDDKIGLLESIAENCNFYNEERIGGHYCHHCGAEMEEDTFGCPEDCLKEEKC